jgi:ankyrin repeat protein
VKLLLDAGADKNQLGWTPLIEAVALGSIADVERLIAGGADLEGTDWWSRTAWLVAILVGDIRTCFKTASRLSRGRPRERTLGRC